MEVYHDERHKNRYFIKQSKVHGMMVLNFPLPSSKLLTKSVVQMRRTNEGSDNKLGQSELLLILSELLSNIFIN